MDHRIVLVDRGSRKTFRWRAACGCGKWSSGNRRTKASVVRAHGAHAHVGHLLEGRSQHLLVGGPRALTPVDRLPEELRPAG